MAMKGANNCLRFVTMADALPLICVYLRLSADDLLASSRTVRE